MAKEEKEKSTKWPFVVAITVIAVGATGMIFGLEYGAQCRMAAFDEGSEEGSRGQLPMMLVYLGATAILQGASWAAYVASPHMPKKGCMFCLRMCTKLAFVPLLLFSTLSIFLGAIFSILMFGGWLVREEEDGHPNYCSSNIWTPSIVLLCLLWLIFLFVLFKGCVGIHRSIYGSEDGTKTKNVTKKSSRRRRRRRRRSRSRSRSSSVSVSGSSLGSDSGAGSASGSDSGSGSDTGSASSSVS